MEPVEEWQFRAEGMLEGCVSQFFRVTKLGFAEISRQRD